MTPTKAPLLPTAKPKHSAFSDSWSSSSTGHQRAENKAGSSIDWKLRRTAKLTVQFEGGAVMEKELPSRFGLGNKSVLGTISNTPAPSGALIVANNVCNTSTRDDFSTKAVREKRIFDNLVIYINGSTYPLISDHKLKHLLAENGAKISINLGRKQVTHIIIGTPAQALRGGAGGGLAAAKMQKEIRKVGGCGIKYVGVEWALESVKAGRRLPEAQFANVKLTLNGQKTVRGNFFDVQLSSKATPSKKKESVGG